MSTIPHLLNGSISDLKALARQYAELTQIKMKGTAKHLAIGSGALVVAGSLAIVAIAELLLSLAIWAVAGEVVMLVRGAALAAGFTLIVAGVLAFIGSRQLKRIDVDPRVKTPSDGAGWRADLHEPGFGPKREDRTWQTIT